VSVRDDLQAWCGTDRRLKVNSQPRPIGSIHGRTSCAICPQDAPTLGVRPLTTLLQSSASIVTIARSLNRGKGAALCAIRGQLSTPLQHAQHACQPTLQYAPIRLRRGS
jgi:hypothetical protein